MSRGKPAEFHSAAEEHTELSPADATGHSVPLAAASPLAPAAEPAGVPDCVGLAVVVRAGRAWAPAGEGAGQTAGPAAKRA